MEMFTFYWALNIIYRLSRFSGFVFNPLQSRESTRASENGKEFLLFVFSFCLSIFLADYVNVYSKTMDFIPSKIVEIGLNVLTRVSMFVSVIIKLNNWIHRKTFIKLVRKYSWCNKNVIIISANSFTLNSIN